MSAFPYRFKPRPAKHSFALSDELFYYNERPLAVNACQSGSEHVPELILCDVDGICACRLTLKNVDVFDQKPVLDHLPTAKENGLPSSTLVFTLEDTARALEVRLYYSLFEDSSVLMMHTEITNSGLQPIQVERCLSSITLPHGHWTAEVYTNTHQREVKKQKIVLSTSSMILEGRKGALPAFVIKNPSLGEYGFALGFSSFFAAVLEQDSYGLTRILLGADIREVLEPGQTLASPEVYCAYDSNNVSPVFHDFFRTWSGNPRPFNDRDESDWCIKMHYWMLYLFYFI
ncbi:hypothetical protein IM774_09475 [Erysipelotrichaceae bacterium RD49]|nr:hypothetical protein [Erysipelotrichaceae bacterium RD49]